MKKEIKHHAAELAVSVNLDYFVDINGSFNILKCLNRVIIAIYFSKKKIFVKSLI